MAYTSPSTINASAGISSILSYVNNVTDFWISRMLILAIFILFTSGYYRAKNNSRFIEALSVGGYATTVIGTLFWVIGFVDNMTFGLVIGVTIAITAILLTSE